MTSKERMIAALTHQEPDRVPRGENAFDYNFFEQEMGRKTLCYGGWDELETLWAGGRDKVVADYIDSLVALTKKMNWDYIRVPTAPKNKDFSGYKRVDDHAFVDDTGKKYEFNPDAGNVVCPIITDPDAEIKRIIANPEPVIEDCEMEIVEAIIKKLGDTHFIIGRPPVGGTFPYLNTIGMEEFLIRMIIEPETIHKLSEIESNKFIAYSEVLLDLGCDAIMETEDYADNKSLIMGVDRFEEFIQPYLKKLCDAVHNKGGYFIKHGDGVMWDVLDKLVEIGVDGWHGIQPSVGMDIKKLKEKYRGKLCLFGGMNVETIIEGDRDVIRKEAEYALEHGAPGGGFVFTSGNILEPGVTAENYAVVSKVWQEMGTRVLNS